jgi:thiamine-monophosphate kinase
MSGEADFLRRLKLLATDPAARGLMDDAAVLGAGAHQLVLTSDTMIEGVHFRPDDPAETVGWKLAAVNLSDLAAKGAAPFACLLNYALKGDSGWDMAFLDGLERALAQFGMALIGGDTVSLPAGAPRMIGLTALGEVPTGQSVPSRAGARPGDRLYVSGPVGDAGVGLAVLSEVREAPEALVAAYRLPQPHVELGRSLAPMARAMMDVSDGLLIDARRMADASGCAVEIGYVPLSQAFEAERGASVEARLTAATAGDDYVLLVALGADVAPPEALIEVGRFRAGEGISILLDGQPVPVPDRLGYEHG